jgi:hypothetical protein
VAKCQANLALVDKMIRYLWLFRLIVNYFSKNLNLKR